MRRIILMVFAAAGTVVIASGGTLGWDESVYAARAKDLVDSGFSWNHRSGPYWSDVRAPGLPVAQSLVFQVFGASDFLARAVVLVSALALLVLVARTLDLWFDRRVGSTAIALVALCPGFLATSTLGFADIPAGFLGAASVYVLARCYREDDVRWLFLVPALLGLATTVRYGAVLLVAAPLLIVAALIARREILRRDWRRLADYVIAGLISAATVYVLLSSRLLTSHLSPVTATRKLHAPTGSPRWNWADDLRTILAPGAVDYGFNGPFWGFTYFVMFGLLGAVAVARLSIFRRLGLLLVCGLISTLPVLLYAATVNLFVTTYLAPIFVSWAASVAIGLWATERVSVNDQVRKIRDHEPPDTPRLLHALGITSWGRFALVSVVAAATVVFAITARATSEMHERLLGFEPIATAADIADDVLGPECVVATMRTPQVSWYSDCYTRGLPGPSDEPGADVLSTGDDHAVDPLDAISAELGLESGVRGGLILLEGLSGQAAIDDLWEYRDEDRSVMLIGPGGRRTALIGINNP